MKALTLDCTSSIFVDLDGTLLDSLEVLYQSYVQLLFTFGIQGDQQNFRMFNGPSLREIAKMIKEQFLLSEDWEVIYEVYLNIIKKNYIYSLAFPDSDFFLNFFKIERKKIILVTSSYKDICFPVIKKLGWTGYFHDYVFGDEVSYSKPNPEIYMKACLKVQDKKENIVVVEDSYNGVRSAVDAGLCVFAVAGKNQSNELKNAGVKQVFDSLTQIVDHFSFFKYDN